LALAAVLLAPVQPAWKLAGITLLLLIRPSTPPRGRLLLFLDGGAVVETEQGHTFPAYRLDGGWVSRWFSVVPLREPTGGRVSRLLVCAAGNPGHEYRRLLQWLRLLRPASAAIRRWNP
jgi:hypothetical protein